MLESSILHIERASFLYESDLVILGNDMGNGNPKDHVIHLGAQNVAA